MNCPKCTNEMILTKATNFGEEYHYCRTCKKELKEIMVLEVVPPPPPPSAHAAKEDHDWVTVVGGTDYCAVCKIDYTDYLAVLTMFGTSRCAPYSYKGLGNIIPGPVSPPSAMKARYAYPAPSSPGFTNFQHDLYYSQTGMCSKCKKCGIIDPSSLLGCTH